MSRPDNDASDMPAASSGTSLDRQRLGMYSIPYTYSLEKPLMDAITYTAARANLARTMDRVCGDHEPLIITRNGEQSVVMMSLEDFKALEETAYLLRVPQNAKRLLEALASLEAGRGRERSLAE
jgi:antitoxin YefM